MPGASKGRSSIRPASKSSPRAALHLWDRYEFGGDQAYLKQIYPVLKGAAEFFVDTLQEDPKGQWLVTNPSISPENGHPFGSAVCAGADDGPANPARPFRQHHQGGGNSRGGQGVRRATRGDPRDLRRTRSVGPGSCRNGGKIGTCERPKWRIATCRICLGCIRAATFIGATRRS